MTEEQIIEGCKKGNANAQKALYEKYCARLKMICLRYVRNSAEADDLFHESLIKIYNKINSFQGKGSFQGWLSSIAVRTAIDHYHKEKKWRTINLEYAREEAELAEEVDDAFELLATQLQKEDMLDMINKLPDGYRMIFNLYAIEQYTHKEIGQMLKISEGTSKSQLSKARRMLKDRIMKYQQSLVENDGGRK